MTDPTSVAPHAYALQHKTIPDPWGSPWDDKNVEKIEAWTVADVESDLRDTHTREFPADDVEAAHHWAARLIESETVYKVVGWTEPEPGLHLPDLVWEQHSLSINLPTHVIKVSNADRLKARAVLDQIEDPDSVIQLPDEPEGSVIWVPARTVQFVTQQVTDLPITRTAPESETTP